jgi:RNA polymerase sigma factor (sigma-70 family)
MRRAFDASRCIEQQVLLVGSREADVRWQQVVGDTNELPPSPAADANCLAHCPIVQVRDSHRLKISPAQFASFVRSRAHSATASEAGNGVSGSTERGRRGCGRLLGAMTVIVQDRAEAEEIVQGAFLKVWERWDRVGEMQEPVGYLYRVGMNLYRSRLRRAGAALRHRVHPARARDELAGVEARDEAARLLASLTPRERAAIVLTGFLDYTSEEAGRLLGIKGDTVRVLVGRGRAKLRVGDEEGSS